VASNSPAWHPEALVDIREARDWYAERSPLAARGFLKALESAVQAVVDAPGRWPSRKHGARQYIFPNQYPYTLVYRVGEQRLLFVAVAHQHREPDYWAHR
jgi:plasmid stabilization system protein ParE